MGNLILENLEINNFKAFEHLCIEKLARVNLIAGKNNVGKTCLLEALSLYASGGAPSVIRDILISRDDAIIERAGIVSTMILNSIGLKSDQKNALLNVAHLSYGRKLVQPNPAAITSERGNSTTASVADLGIINSNFGKISIGYLNSGDDALLLSIGWFRVIEDQTNPENSKLVPVSSQEHADFEDAAPYLIGQYRKKSTRILLSRIFLAKYTDSSQYTPLHRCIFVRANGLSIQEVNHLWNETQLTILEDSVINVLRVIAPDVERISMKELQDDSRKPSPIVKMAGMDEPVPLRSLGDGMSRAFGIALALVNAKDGFLLVDEIENGLYHGIMPDLWRLILKSAKELNVQVFATTHSWDCVEGFQEATADGEEEEGMMIRLNQKKIGITATLYDRRRITIATEDKIEVR